MAVGIKKNEKSGAEAYPDIINLPHWEPNKKHPRMSLNDRAAQFAPFAALSGYDEMVAEEARMTDSKIELGEDGLNDLNRKLGVISTALEGGDHPVVNITYFVPDPLKAGGSYTTVSEVVKRIDPVHQRVVLTSGTEIDISNVLDITGDVLDDGEW